jgi:hypothetical protein
MTTTPLPDELAALLGLPSATLHLAASPPPEELPQARGLDRAASAAAHFDPRTAAGPPLPLALPARSPLVLSRAFSEPAVFLVEPRGPFTLLRGMVDPLDGEGGLLVADSRTGPVSLRQGAWLLDLDAGRVQIWRLPAEPGPRLRGEARAPRAEPPPWPGLEALTEGYSCPTWLERRVRMLAASADPLDGLVAAGMLHRLWSPGDRPERQRALQAALAGAAPMVGPIRAWLAGVPAWEGLEEEARLRALALAVEIEGLAELLQESEPDARAGASRVLAARDDLASIAAALAIAGRPPGPWHEAILAADRAAFQHSAALADTLLLDADDPWLLAVGRAEPEAWWGGLIRT